MAEKSAKVAPEPINQSEMTRAEEGQSAEVKKTATASTNASSDEVFSSTTMSNYLPTSASADVLMVASRLPSKEQPSLLRAGTTSSAAASEAAFSIGSAQHSVNTSASDLGFYPQFRDVDWSARPVTLDAETDEALPVKIEVMVTCKKFTVSDAEGSEYLTYDGDLQFYWRDPRLIGYPVAVKNKHGLPEGLWKPQLVACNGLLLQSDGEKGKVLNAEKGEGKPSPGGDLHTTGAVCWSIPIVLKGRGVSLQHEVRRMKAFPYDSVRVDLSVMLVGGRHETTKDIDLALDRPNLQSKLSDGFSGRCQQVQWNSSMLSGDYEMAAVSLGVAKASTPGMDKWLAQIPQNTKDPLTQTWRFTPPGVALSLHLRRVPNFHVQKGVVPLFLCAAFALMTFCARPFELIGRLQVLFGLFLSCFAIQWVLVERLPRLPVRTVLDDVVFRVVFGLAFMALGQCAAFQLGLRVSVASWSFGGGSTSSGPTSTSAGFKEEDEDVVYVENTVSARAGGPFNEDIAETADWVVAGLSLAYLAGRGFAFGLLWRVRQLSREFGCFRPWAKGREFKHRTLHMVPGRCFRLDILPEWPSGAASFLGMGREVSVDEF